MICCECGDKLTGKKTMYRQDIEGNMRPVCPKCDRELHLMYVEWSNHVQHAKKEAQA